MARRRAFTILAILVGCGAPPHEPVRPAPTRATAAPPAPHHLLDPDLNHREAPKLLAIDWSAIHLSNAADALALWQRIAPTGDDWEQKLREIPEDIARPLAIALLGEGNFACAPIKQSCNAPLELPEPAATATLVDPCLRRYLAMWAIEQLEVADLPAVRDALRAIVAIPPPESQLVESALRAYDGVDADEELELSVRASQAGQRELASAALSGTDEPFKLAALARHVAPQMLPLAGNEAAFRAAIADEQLATEARVDMITDLEIDDPKAPETRAAMRTAAKSPDCRVAAAAARSLDRLGDRSRAPKLPRTRSPDAMMRALCVLASYEAMQHADEASYLPSFVPSRGLELVRVHYDEYDEPHETKTIDLVKPFEVVLPDIEELQLAMKHCAGTSCKTAEHEFRFGFQLQGGQLLLARLEVRELPPCRDKQTISNP